MHAQICKVRMAFYIGADTAHVMHWLILVQVQLSWATVAVRPGAILYRVTTR